MRDLDLDHQVGSGAFDEGVGCLHPFGESRAKVPGVLAEIERAVGLHPRAGRIAPPPKTGAAQHFHRTGEIFARDIHDVVEVVGQLLMGERGRHQGDEPACRVDADLAEVPVPVDCGQRGNGLGVGVQDVESGAEGSGVRRGRLLHGGCSSRYRRDLQYTRATGRLRPAPESVTQSLLSHTA